MSIAVLGPAPPDRGGIARETSRLVEELGRLKGVDVLWLTFSRRYPRRLDPRRFDRFEDDAAAAPAAAMPILDWASPRSWRDAAARAAGEAPDGLLVPWWTAFWALPVRAVMRAVRRASPRTPRVLLCHNVEDHEGGAGRRLLARGALTAADAYVVHAVADRDRLARIAPGRPVVVLPHPVEALPPRSREDARRRLGLEADAPLVLFLGLVRRYKGVDLLLDAAPAIVRETGARVAVVGEVFPDALELSKRAAASPVKERVIWKDEYVGEEEMRDWMAACDAAVLPYRAISGSGIAARAFAARRPAVAARAGGLPDVVVPGATGELFEPDDAAGLAAAVRTALSRPPGFYEKGLAAAAERASWPRYAEAVHDFVLSSSSRAQRGTPF